MAYLEVSAFKKLRAFFWGLQKSSFNLSKIPPRDNEGTPIDKAYCLNLLHSFPDFQGEKFKDDNFLIKYLSKSGNLKQILDQFTPAQQIELTKVLEEKGVATEATGEQPSTQIAPAEQTVPAQTPVGEAPGTMGMPGLPSTPSISSVGSNIGSSAQIGIKKAGTRLGSTFSSFLGGVGRTSGGLLGGAIGGGGRALGNFGLKTIDFGARFSSAVSTRGSAFATAGRGGARWAVIGFSGLFLLTGLLAVFGPPLPGQDQPTAVAQPLAGGSIDSCQFTRGDQNPKATPYKSTTLSGYFQEAANKSGVPAAVLAGIARVESPGIVNLTNDNLTSFGCPTSPTGAKGLMQIQPPGTTGHPADGVALGASYLGIPVDQLNFCDLRQSIFLGAGVVNSKRAGGKWDPSQNNNKSYTDSVAESYYGCLKYPSCTSGPYNYGDDLWASLQGCQVPTLAGTSEFVYYCQGNTAWQNTCSLGQTGCGPSSLAMVLSSFKVTMTPPQVDREFQSHGWRSCGNSPSSMVAALQSQWLKDLGFEVGPNIVKGSALDMEATEKYLDRFQGYLIIGSSSQYPCANCIVGSLVDHIFVIDAINRESGTVSIRDPNNCSYANGNDENQTNRIKRANSFPWLYAYPIKKVR